MIRRITLWTGTTLSVLIAAAFVVSGWWKVEFQIPMMHGARVQVGHGGFRVFSYLWGDWASVERISNWAADWHWWNHWGAGTRYDPVPLYAPFAIVAIPTLLAWRFWPKPIEPGHCPCGYNLMGNTSGVCPECGRGTTETR